MRRKNMVLAAMASPNSATRIAKVALLYVQLASASELPGNLLKALDQFVQRKPSSVSPEECHEVIEE
jgi:hypothetical protein